MSRSHSVQTMCKQQTSNHAVIVLASGLSQRLGQAKQLLFKHGEPLICSMIKLALSTKPQAIIVVIPDDPLIANAISELVSQHTIIYVIMNSTPKTGMAHSLYLSIESLINLGDSLINRVLIMGVDQVLLDKQHLIALLKGTKTVIASGYNSWTHLDEMCANANAAKNTSTKNIIGLPLTIDCALLRQWQSALVGDKGLRHLIRALPPSQLSTVFNAQLSYDIDTPAQLAYAQQKGWLAE